MATTTCKRPYEAEDRPLTSYIIFYILHHDGTNRGHTRDSTRARPGGRFEFSICDRVPYCNLLHYIMLHGTCSHGAWFNRSVKPYLIRGYVIMHMVNIPTGRYVLGMRQANRLFHVELFIPCT